jgi:signal transduction histidine kinase
VLIDITERKGLESELSQSQRLESVGRLAAGIAHEINTPAQYITDNLHFLQQEIGDLLALIPHGAGRQEDRAPDQTPPEPSRSNATGARPASDEQDIDYEFLRAELPQSVAQSIEGITRITHIVAAMKDFSHPGAAAKEPIDVNRAIAAAVTVCSNHWRDIAEIDFDLDPLLPTVPCVVADFNQAILHLVVNAAEAIKERGNEDKGTIRISSRLVGDAVEIQVSDDGVGIPEENLDKIFDPFFTTKDVGKGTGHGLAIAHDVIVRDHAGALLCKSQPGEGATFTIRISIDQPTTSEAAPSCSSPTDASN